MELVIKISEEEYEKAKHGTSSDAAMRKAINNGTPLKAGEMLIPTSVAEALLVLKGLHRIYDDNDGDKHIIDRIMEKVRAITHYHAMNNAERKESEDKE